MPRYTPKPTTVNVPSVNQISAPTSVPSRDPNLNLGPAPNIIPSSEPSLGRSKIY